MYFCNSKNKAGYYDNFLCPEGRQEPERSSNTCVHWNLCSSRVPSNKVHPQTEEEEDRNGNGEIKLNCGGVDCIFRIAVYNFTPGHIPDPGTTIDEGRINIESP